MFMMFMFGVRLFGFKHFKAEYVAVNAEKYHKVDGKQYGGNHQYPPIIIFFWGTWRMHASGIVTINKATADVNSPPHHHHHAREHNNRHFIGVEEFMDFKDKPGGRRGKAEIGERPQHRNKCGQYATKHMTQFRCQHRKTEMSFKK